MEERAIKIGIKLIMLALMAMMAGAMLYAALCPPNGASKERVDKLEAAMHEWISWQEEILARVGVTERDIEVSKLTQRVRNERLCALEECRAVVPEVVE